MAKPILIIRTPDYVDQKKLDEVTQHTKDKLDDYHVIAVSSGNDKFTFEVLNGINYKGKDLEDLKKFLQKP